MINRLLARIYRPEKNWDPVMQEYAQNYTASEWLNLNEAFLDDLEVKVGGFKGKRILDLGGGPGHYSVAFARRGAKVTWHDVSKTYRKIAEEKAIDYQVSDKISFSLGYLDEAPQVLSETFDLVFNRICWYYGFNDKSFAEVVYQLVSPGGFAYVDTNNATFQIEQMSISAKFRTYLNNVLHIKIGHPYPPRGRLAHLFLAYPIKKLCVDYSGNFNDKIIFEKLM
jgi:2-polyprenyl-3-methyl-5-hydroxy-6-metoxy-1,4-benzoquinol methylase